MKKDLIQSIKVVFLALVLATGVSFVSAAWNEPTGAPPSNNAPEPINVSGTAQIKDGGVVLSALGGTGNQTIIGRAADAIGAYFRAVVYGNLGADKYCDRAGQNCKTILELGNPGGVDDKQVKTSSTDTTANYLINELVAGNGIAITETGTTDKKVTVSSSGVSKIIAGTGITVSPTGGTGDVTVSASGGGGGGEGLPSGLYAFALGSMKTPISGLSDYSRIATLKFGRIFGNGIQITASASGRTGQARVQNGQLQTRATATGCDSGWLTSNWAVTSGCSGALVCATAFNEGVVLTIYRPGNPKSNCPPATGVAFSGDYLASKLWEDWD